MQMIFDSVGAKQWKKLLALPDFADIQPSQILADLETVQIQSSSAYRERIKSSTKLSSGLRAALVVDISLYHVLKSNAMGQEEERLTNATNSVLARPSSPLYQCLSSRKRRGLGYVKLQEPYRKRRSSVRVLRLGATKARKLTWHLRPKLLRLRFLSPGLLLKKLTGAFLKFATIFAAKNELPADRVVEGICLQLHQSAAYIAYLERTIAEGRFYRNGMAILDLKDL